MKNLICIQCPNSCVLEINGKNISGNECDKGIEFAKTEIENPQRMLTSTVCVSNGEYPVVSVRSVGLVPKNDIQKIINQLNILRIKAPVKAEQTIADNIIATSDVEAVL